MMLDLNINISDAASEQILNKQLKVGRVRTDKLIELLVILVCVEKYEAAAVIRDELEKRRGS